MKKKINYIKKKILESPLAVKIIIGGIFILLLSLNMNWSCNNKGISCNAEYDPPEIEQIKGVVK